MIAIVFSLCYCYLSLYEFIYYKIGVFPSAKTKKQILFHRILFRTALFILTIVVFFTVVIVIGMNVHFYNINPYYFFGAA